jgi:hypothetical protein
MKQWQEIGETDWMYCQTESWFEHCKKSAEHDTRDVKPNQSFTVYTDQFKTKEAE